MSHTIKNWSKKDIEYLKANYPDTSTKVLALKMDRKESAVYAMAFVHGIKKTSGYLKEHAAQFRAGKRNSISTEFKKGAAPINKGKKWEEYMTVHGMRQARGTSFKKGNLPYNTKSDGVISIRKDKSGKSYQFIRISKAKWISLAHYIWSQAHGPVPKGHCVIFKDMNTLNANIENLELITLAQNCIRNSIQRYPLELRSAMKVLKKLKQSINNH